MNIRFHAFIFQIMALACFSTALMSAEPQTIPQQETPQNQRPTITELQFTPPQGWKFAETKDLPTSVKVMVVGKGTHEFPPSINVGTEAFTGTLKQYLKRVKEINTSKGNEWKDLGTITTQAGEASLSQADSKTQWGDIRMMHVILNQNNTIYIVTAAASKEDFPKFYKDFFNAFRSIRFNAQTTPSN